LLPRWQQKQAGLNLPIGYPNVRELPGIRWKLQNLERFRRGQERRYSEARTNLDRVLERMGYVR